MKIYSSRAKESSWRFQYSDRFLIGLLVFLLLVTFASSNNYTARLNAFKSLEQGMTKVQLINVMGTPDQVQNLRNGGLRLCWSHIQSARGNVSANTRTHFYAYLNKEGLMYKKDPQ